MYKACIQSVRCTLQNYMHKKSSTNLRLDEPDVDGSSLVLDIEYIEFQL